jgi:chemotaxis protein methyltransferase CheR
VTLPASLHGRLDRLFVEWTGIDLGRGRGWQSLERFVAERVRALDLPSSEAYLSRLHDAEELQKLVNCATTGLTWFFRDPEQLEAIATVIRGSYGPNRIVHIWVPGCATGEDAYSIAMLGEELGRPLRVLGTDINTDFLSRARLAQFSTWSMRGLPPICQRHFTPAAGGLLELRPSLRRSVRFQRHNLLDEPPHPPGGSQSWDLIVCRNVLLYFPARRATQAVERVLKSMREDGWLFLGASDLLQCLPRDAHVVEVKERQALRRAPAPPPPPPLLAPSPTSAPSLPRPEDFRDGEVTAEIERIPPRDEAATAIAALPKLLDAANERHTAGQLSDALQLYSQVLALDPLHVEARMLLGIAYHKIGDHAAAAQALRAALFLVPRLWPAAFYLALSLERAELRAEAMREYQRVVDCAGEPLPFEAAPGILGELAAWKRDVVMLARDRARQGGREGARWR